MKWEVELAGENFDLEEVAYSLSSDVIDIKKTDDKYILRSSLFESLDDIKKVQEAAFNILGIINGTIKLHLNSRNPIELGSIVNRENNSGRIIHASLVDGFHIRDKFIANYIHNGITEESRPLDAAKKYFSVAARNDNVSLVLRHLSNQKLNWVTLYRVYEMIEDEVGGSTVLKSNGWITGNQLTRFTRTANSPIVVGEEARHGKTHQEPPPNPMTLDEAIGFITKLVHSWINSKVL